MTRLDPLPQDLRERADIPQPEHHNGKGQSSGAYDPKSQPYKEVGTWEDNESGNKGKGERPPLRSVRFNEIPDPGPRRYLLAGLVPEGYITLLHGDGGVAKSMLVLSYGLAVAERVDR
jgi:hypothetical protein